MICSATESLTCSATGTGWYGDPVQHGWATPRGHSLTCSVSGLTGRGRSGASRASTAFPPSLVPWDRSIRLTETVIEVWLLTSGAPVSSVIIPRTAGTTTVLVWLDAARALYCPVSSTCR